MITTSNRCPRLFTVTEVAEQMKVSGRTVRRKISGGELHFHRLGRQIRVSEEDLLSLPQPAPPIVSARVTQSPAVSTSNTVLVNTSRGRPLEKSYCSINYFYPIVLL